MTPVAAAFVAAVRTLPSHYTPNTATVRLLDKCPNCHALCLWVGRHDPDHGGGTDWEICCRKCR